MSTPTIERTGDWDSVPFTGGFAGLRDLADDDFSGMVTAGPTRLFMLRGAVVGILDGDIEDFADGGGTAREAPHPALPLLAVMQERSDEVRAKYYTEETPLSEVDRTLADGNFTGYIELAENVLSGDYYQVYHQGRSMSVAYVGASERLITDDEAFDQADDEVGIYEVRPVDVEIIDIPEPDEDSTGATAAAGGADAGIDTDTDATDDSGSSDVTAADAGPADEDAADEGAADVAGSAPDETTGADDATDTAAGAGAAPESDTTTAAADAGVAEDPAASDDQAVGEADPEDDSGAGTTSAGAATSSEAEDPERSEATASEPSTETSPDASGDPSGSTAGAGASTAAGAGSQSAEPSTAESPPAESTPGGSQRAESSAADQSTTSPAQSGSTGDAGAGQSGGTPSGGQGGRSQQGRPASDHPAAGNRGQAGGSGGNGSAGADRSEASIGAGDLEVRSLPSLDPSRTASASRQERERRSASGGAATSGNGQGSEPAQSAGRSQQQSADTAGTAGTGGSTRGSGAAGESGQPAGGTAAEQQGTSEANARPATAEQAANEPADATQAESAAATADTEPAGGPSSEELEEARAEVQRLESELSELKGEHEAVVEERDRLEAELAEAREEIDRLRGRLEDAADQGTEASQKLSPRQAIDETNLFIRYDSKGEATLEKAHAGDVGKDAVDANMRLEYHTSFDANDAAVDGVDFDSFLTDTVQYRFVDWLVRQLLYEIRDTGNTGSMGELYDALPKVDRAELNGQVGVQYTENGEEHRAQVGFDVIVRDRMGNPLIVANLNDSRDPATDSMMTDLVRAAERVGESSSSLAGAFLVTRSFFEPEALETAEEATAGGLLNRGKQKSFVNLSRKGGYHLCLVEARNQEFHLAVPEL